MVIREAKPRDIEQIQIVRNSVKENTLSDPRLVSDHDCEYFITTRGKGWVCETDGKIVGFCIADLVKNNIWALFIHPEYENRGIGKQLHDVMLQWYFSKKQTPVWLSTTPETRAVGFYKKQGWNEIGIHGEDEIKFEMTYTNWKKQQ
ncbi:MAG: GNAT family N-acetyltransferase [Flavobacterium sp.]